MTPVVVHPDDTTRALRRDAAENRKRILDAAGCVFAEHGLDGSVEEVAVFGKDGFQADHAMDLA